MIQMPQRSVTRFFIPLIDVLILLFCIYLLLPIVGGSGEKRDQATSTEDASSGALSALERRELEQLRGQAERRAAPALIEAERQEIARLRQEKIETLQQRLAIRVLEIDADTGKLLHYDPESVEIASEPQARALIERQRGQTVGRELYFLILFPHKRTGYPEERQVRQYDRWFEGVAHGFSDPRANR